MDAWWHEPVDLAAARAKYGPRIEGREPTHVYLVLADERPIGWIQWYRWADYPDHAAKLGARSDEAGVDLAIGDAELVGRGIGTRLLAGFVDEVVFSDPGIAGCVSDPESRNARSVRAFQKAGFAIETRLELPGETVERVVMRRRRAPAPR